MSPVADQPDWLRTQQFGTTQLAQGLISAVAWPVNTGQYASVRVMLFNTNGTSLATAVYQFDDSASNQTLDQGLLSANAATLNPDWPVWNLPTMGDQFTLASVDPNVKCIVVATNREMRKGMAGDASPVRTMQGVIAANAPAGTTVELLGVDATNNDAIRQLNCSNYNGQITMQWSSNAAAPTGNGFARYIDAAGNEQTPLLFQNFSTTIQRLVTGHPFAYTRWRFVSNAVQGAAPATLTLLIIPAETFPN